MRQGLQLTPSDRWQQQKQLQPQALQPLPPPLLQPQPQLSQAQTQIAVKLLSEGSRMRVSSLTRWSGIGVPPIYDHVQRASSRPPYIDHVLMV
eukprot:XP_001697932.1 predicted protein [Chlamydomonas reinhardtii]